MQKENLNVYFKETLSNINFDGDIVAEIKREKASRPEEIRIPDEFLQSPQVLSFVIYDDEYIKANFDKIKPSSKGDAYLKLSAYVMYHAYLADSIIESFIKCRKEFKFKYYRNIKVFEEKCNPLHIYIRKHIVEEQISAFSKESVTALSKLMSLVDFDEKDHKNRRAMFYITKAHIDIRLDLAKLSRKVCDHNLMLDVMSKIEHAIKRGLSSIPLDRKYLDIVKELPKYKQFIKISQSYHFRLHEEPGNNILRIRSNKPMITPVRYL